jgi:hypothetical protein
VRKGCGEDIVKAELKVNMKYGISQKNIYWYILQKKGIMTAVVHL